MNIWDSRFCLNTETLFLRQEKESGGGGGGEEKEEEIGEEEEEIMRKGRNEELKIKRRKNFRFCSQIITYIMSRQLGS